MAGPFGYAPEDVRRLHDILRKRTQAFGFPVLADTDTGHTAPLQTLPIGCAALLDSSANHFTIAEPAVCTEER